MMRGVNSPAEQRQRQRRGGLTTLARVGGQAMTEPARAGFRARFEREALEYAAAHGQTLTTKQLAEATDARLQAHMSRMAEARLKKAAERKRRATRAEQAPSQPMTAQARRSATPVTPAVVVRPVRLCVGCWLEMLPGEPFPAETSSILCARHLETYVSAATTAQP